MLDGRLQLRGAAYYIDWDDLPLSLAADCGFFVTVNAGEAASKGVELEATAVLMENWRADFGFSYTNAELSEDQPTLGESGDPLPGTPEYVFSLGTEYAFPLFGRDAFARIDWSYVSEYYNNVRQTGQVLGGYHEVNLSAGMNLDKINVRVFINNATDSDAILWNDTEIGDGRVQRQRPRTIGLTVGYRF